MASHFWVKGHTFPTYPGPGIGTLPYRSYSLESHRKSSGMWHFSSIFVAFSGVHGSFAFETSPCMPCFLVFKHWCLQTTGSTTITLSYKLLNRGHFHAFSVWVRHAISARFCCASKPRERSFCSMLLVRSNCQLWVKEAAGINSCKKPYQHDMYGTCKTYETYKTASQVKTCHNITAKRLAERCKAASPGAFWRSPRPASRQKPATVSHGCSTLHSNLLPFLTVFKHVGCVLICNLCNTWPIKTVQARWKAHAHHVL